MTEDTPPYLHFEECYDKGHYGMMARDAFGELASRSFERSESATTYDQRIDYLVALYASKQRDYGHDNILKFGKDGVLVRLWDKVARWNNLTARGGEAANEPLEDTLKDIIGYCVILQMLEDDTFTLPLAEDVRGMTINKVLSAIPSAAFGGDCIACAVTPNGDIYDVVEVHWEGEGEVCFHLG